MSHNTSINVHNFNIFLKFQVPVIQILWNTLAVAMFTKHLFQLVQLKALDSEIKFEVEKLTNSENEFK